MEKNNFLKGLRKLREDLRPMTFAQKVDHIWTYYKEIMLIALVVILLLIGTVSSILNLGRVTYLSGVLCNVGISQEGHNYLVERIAEEYQVTDDIFLSNIQYEVPVVVGQVDHSYEVAMGMVAQVESKTLDYVILDQVGLDFFAGQEMFLDLREFFTEEELAQWEKKLIYVEFEDHPGIREPLALDITDLPFVKDCIRCEGKVYLALAGNLPRPEATRQFWDDLLAWEKES